VSKNAHPEYDSYVTGCYNYVCHIWPCQLLECPKYFIH